MSDAGLRVDVVSRTKLLWKGRASYVAIPLEDGSLGILRGRQPLLSTLGTGVVEITVPGKDTPVLVEVNGGFASLDSDFVTVVAEGGKVLSN